MIDKVRELFAKYEVQLSVEEPQSETATEVQLAAAMLDSGQEIQTSAEAFAEGADVFVINEDGEQIPLPDGSYTLDNGVTFAVAEGVISSMTEAAEVEAEAVEQSSDEEPAEEQLSKAEVAEMIKEAVVELSAHVDKLVTAIETKESELTQLSKQAAGKISRTETPQKKTYSQRELSEMDSLTRIRVIQSQFN